MDGHLRRLRRRFSRLPIWCRRFCRLCPASLGRFRATTENILIICGAACLIAPLAVPQRVGAHLFALVWVGFLLFLDPINRRLGLPSFLGDLSEGFRRRVYGFVLAGWICGWLWEFWNYWAAAKWHYIFPMFQRVEDICDAGAGVSGISAVCAGVFRDVRYRGMAGGLGEESEMIASAKFLHALLPLGAARIDLVRDERVAGTRWRKARVAARGQASDGYDVLGRFRRRHRNTSRPGAVAAG